MLSKSIRGCSFSKKPEPNTASGASQQSTPLWSLAAVLIILLCNKLLLQTLKPQLFYYLLWLHTLTRGWFCCWSHFGLSCSCSLIVAKAGVLGGLTFDAGTGGPIQLSMHCQGHYMQPQGPFMQPLGPCINLRVPPRSLRVPACSPSVPPWSPKVLACSPRVPLCSPRVPACNSRVPPWSPEVSLCSPSVPPCSPRGLAYSPRVPPWSSRVSLCSPGSLYGAGQVNFLYDCSELPRAEKQKLPVLPKV